MQIHRYGALALGIYLISNGAILAQSLNSGTIEGLVKDPSGAVITNATVTIRNPITGYQATVGTSTTGSFHFSNIPLNSYHLNVKAPGFTDSEQDVNVRNTLPLSLEIPLALAGENVTMNVEATGETLVENEFSTHTDVDRDLFSKMPSTSAGNGLSDIVTFSVGNVAADSNGSIHAQGDDAETSLNVDGQPITDRQSKLFSTQLPLNALQGMELVTGAPSAEFGDKSSLVINATTRSALGSKLFGSFAPYWQSYGTYGEDATLGFGGAKWGNFIALDTVRSGRFLDTPEFAPLHARGNNVTFFDRIDFNPNATDAFHLNLFAARNWFQTPNTYDQLDQDQRQQVVSFNIAPSYQHVFNTHMLFTSNLFARRDRIDYYPSRDAFADTPATLAQERYLTNYGVKAAISYVRGGNDLKVGVQVMQTRLRETFSLGLTDPMFNAVCANADGTPALAPGVVNPSNCPGGETANPGFLSSLLPYDLTRGGGPFQFAGRHNVNEYAFYVQDSITFHGLNVGGGVRFDDYHGLVAQNGVEPRFGTSYLIKRTKTVLRASYSRAFETPFNENLILSSSTGSGGLATNVFGAFAQKAISPGRRDQYDTGVQQGLGAYLQIDADYFWKYTTNAFDFDTLFNTPITFPINWRRSKIDGVGMRISSTNIHGFQLFTTMGHTRARFFGPESGGIIFNSPLNSSVFRIDHDQAFQQTTNLRYQRPKNAEWVDFTWRYDSGLVAGHVPTIASALGLTAAQQAAIGFFCGSNQASLTNRITTCDSGGGATRLVVPKAGTENDDTNPPRIAPRNLLDLGIGSDNLFHREGSRRITARFTITNLLNKQALYNFLSTFSGTHFIPPRTYQVAMGYVF